MTPTTAGPPRPATQGTVRRGDLAAVWTSAEARVVAEVDLDAEQPAPPPRRRPLVAAAVVVGVAGLVAASALRSAVTAPPAPPAPAVTAWMSLRSVDPGQAGGTPSVDVLVSVANRGATDRLVTAVAVRGTTAAGPVQDTSAAGDDGEPDRPPDRALPGTRPATLPLAVPAGTVAVTAVRVPLRCPAAGATDSTAGAPTAGPGFDLALTLADDATAVVALAVGPLAAADGACAAAAASRPEGAGAPLAVRSARFTATSARLVLEGLPATARVTAVEADGIVLPLVAQAGDGRRTLALGAPAAGCSPGARGVVPTGVQVRLDAGQVRFADVGADLARWLLATRCPAAAPR